MTLIEIVRSEAGGEQRRLIVIALLAALANTSILVALISAVHAQERARLLEIVPIVVALIIFVGSSRRLTRRVAQLIEAALHRIRVRVGAKLIRAELDVLERVDVNQICDRLTDNIRFISDRADVLASALSSVVLLAALSIYIAWLDLVVFMLLGVTIVIGIGLSMSSRREFVAAIRASYAQRSEFMARFCDLLDGSKQLAFSHAARRDLLVDIESASASLRESEIRSSLKFADNNLQIAGLGFALLGVVAFAVPGYVGLDARVLSTMIIVAMYLRAPVSMLASNMMPYVRSNLALAEITRLEAELDRITSTGTLEQGDPFRPAPERIVVDAIEYRYPRAVGVDGRSGAGFALGPLTLQLEAGTITFVVGGNGSGKSTLFKALASLYPAHAGTLELDGICVDSGNRLAYRERISAVFADFHLFERLYGMREVEASEVRRLLALLELTGVVDYVDGSFTRLELSTGQRKRLALLVTLLEDRPVVVLDEWAADQDPHFRRWFYEQLLPQLRAAGKIVVAISHDDRYFGVADCVVAMADGQRRSITSAEQESRSGA